jgi:hypothetical protein
MTDVWAEAGRGGEAILVVKACRMPDGGKVLVADDRVLVSDREGLLAERPDAPRPLVEALTGLCGITVAVHGPRGPIGQGWLPVQAATTCFPAPSA